MEILVIHGPNLNLLGEREPAIYGSTTLEAINQSLENAGQQIGAKITFFQSNSESAIIDKIHEARQLDIEGIIINPAAFTHTSVAIRDALSAVNIPTIEVHLSNISAREEFRRKSYITPVALGQICGFGAYGYIMALDAMINFLRKKDN
ncbi:MAG: type II 3-dehydroquinate dehydratase [bacterium]